MSESAASIADLEARVRRLEALYAVVDLLALPGMLTGGAARLFDARQTADTLPDRATGFFPKESARRDLAIRWTRFPEPGELAAPVFQGFPFQVELAVLAMPHISAAEDVGLRFDGETLALSPPVARGAVLTFAAEFVPARNGLVVVQLTSRAPLPTAASDQRQLGLPFVSLRTRPKFAPDPGPTPAASAIPSTPALG